MRLGQLARKLKLEPTAIISFLANENIVIENSPNVKIENEVLNLVIKHFEATPDPLEPIEIVENTIITPTEEFDSTLIDNNEVLTLEKEDNTADELEENTETTDSSSELDSDVSKTVTVNYHGSINDLDDVIRAPKVKLEGIKVIGKIELPEDKKAKKTIPTTSVQDNNTVTNKISKKPPIEAVHPNKRNRVPSIKPTIVADRKETQVQEKKPLTKLEIKEKRRIVKAKQKKKKKKKLPNSQQEPKRNKEKPTPPPKRGFWAKLFGIRNK